MLVVRISKKQCSRFLVKNYEEVLHVGLITCAKETRV